MKINKDENLVFIAVMIIIALTFFYFILGISGAISILGIVLFFVVPIYVLLGNFCFENDERIIFSFFIGVGIFPSIVYWLGMFISFKLSIFLAFIIMMASGLAAKHFKIE